METVSEISDNKGDTWESGYFSSRGTDKQEETKPSSSSSRVFLEVKESPIPLYLYQLLRQNPGPQARESIKDALEFFNTDIREPMTQSSEFTRARKRLRAASVHLPAEYDGKLRLIHAMLRADHQDARDDTEKWYGERLKPTLLEHLESLKPLLEPSEYDRVRSKLMRLFED